MMYSEKQDWLRAASKSRKGLDATEKMRKLLKTRT